MELKREEHIARQNQLYNFLLERGDNWTSMEQATDSCKLYPTFYTGTYHNSWTRRLLTEDIERINASAKFEKVIISGSRGIKIATEEEFSRFIGSELGEIFGKLKRVRRLAKKGSRNMQIDFEGQVRKAFLEESDGEGKGNI